MSAAATSSPTPEAAPAIADQIAARIVWFDEEPMLPGRTYAIKCGCQTTTATISSLKYKLNVDNLDHVAGKTLELNEVGACNLSTGKALVFDPYAENAETGSFILIDRFTNATVAAGMIEFGLRRATNIQWQALSIDKMARVGAEGPEALRALVHRAVGLRQVDHRQYAREAAARAWPPHLRARRRQYPPWPQQGSRLHRRRPGREYPPRGGDGEAVRGGGPDRHGVVHLAVPLRAAHGARAVPGGRVHRGLSSIRRSRSARRAIRRGSTARRAPG